MNTSARAKLRSIHSWCSPYRPARTRVAERRQSRWTTDGPDREDHLARPAHVEKPDGDQSASARNPRGQDICSANRPMHPRPATEQSGCEPELEGGADKSNAAGQRMENEHRLAPP